MLRCDVVLQPQVLLTNHVFFFLSFHHSGDETETDSEVEDRVDGVKSWLSKNKGSCKTLSDEGSLKSTRLVRPSFLHQDKRKPCATPWRRCDKARHNRSLKKKRLKITWGSLQQKDGYFM